MLLLLAVAAFAADPQPLFHIERSKNANIVEYDVVVGADGAPDPKAPVVAYWVMKADKGETVPLTLPERKAYGVSAKPVADGFRLYLAAFKDREVTLTSDGGHWRARVAISGKDAWLDHIYVKTKEEVVPQVLEVDLFGTDATTGADVQEVITPGQKG